jgi:quercetin dioxygenase-like cupin family protein
MAEELLYNSVTGEKFYIIESSPECFKFRYSMGPHSEIPRAHSHPKMTQTVTVLSGTIHFRLDGKELIINAGETKTLLPGVSHFQWNPTDEEVVAIEQHVPAERIHDFFKVIINLAENGETDAQGSPSLLMASVLFMYFRGTIRPEPLLLRFVLILVSPLAWVLGYHRRLQRYLPEQGALTFSGNSPSN